MQEIVKRYHVYEIRGTHGMIVVVNKEELAFLMLCSRQVIVGLFGFIVG